MTGLQDLRAAIADWDGHRLELARLSIAREDDWRKRTVQYRRLIQGDIARIAAAASGVFDQVAPVDEPHAKAFRGGFSAMRSRVAEHQASWPVVGIDPDDPEYDRSVQALRAVSDEFATQSALLIDRLAAGGAATAPASAANGPAAHSTQSSPMSR